LSPSSGETGFQVCLQIHNLYRYTEESTELQKALSEALERAEVETERADTEKERADAAEAKLADMSALNADAETKLDEERARSVGGGACTITCVFISEWTMESEWCFCEWCFQACEHVISPSSLP
jgi:hypothetical protein